MTDFAIIRPRGDTTANWTTANPVLKLRELGMDTDKAQFKVGDGVTHWNDLPWFSDPSRAAAVDSPTPPDDAVDGQLWFNITDGRLYTFYDHFWIEVGGGGTGISQQVFDSEVAAREAGDAASVPLASKGQPNGVPSLDGGGKVPVGQLPDGIGGVAEEEAARIAADADLAADLAAEAATRSAQDILRIPYSIFSGHREGKPLVADPYDPSGVRVRHQGPRGGRAAVIGTSIEVGAGGDQDLSFAVGRWSNASWFTQLCAGSNGLLDMVKNAALGGDTLGGIGELCAPVNIGDDHVDIRTTFGPPGTGPFNLESVFTDVGGPDQEGWYVSGWIRIPDPDGLIGTTCTRIFFNIIPPGLAIKAHPKGAEVGWGMIGRFDRDVPDNVDILFIGGPINNVGKTDWTPENCALGQQMLAELGMRRGMFPVMCTVTPGPTLKDERDAVNRAVRNSHRMHGHASCDFYPYVVDPATRGVKAEITTDTLHYNQEGAEILAQAMMSEVVDKLEFAREQNRLSYANGDYVNLLPNANFINSNGQSPETGAFAPESWTVHEFFSDGIQQRIVPSRYLDQLNGNLVQIEAFPGRGTRGVRVDLDPSLFSEGDVLYMKIFARFYGFFADTTGASFCKATASLGVSGTDGAVSLPVFFQYMRDYDGGIFSAYQTVPDNVGTINAVTYSIVLGCPPLMEGLGPDHGWGIVEAGLPLLVNTTKQVIL